METPEYQKIEDEVKKSLNTPGKLKELSENENWKVRFVLAESLKITPDMPEELLKEAKEVAEKLLHDEKWKVRFAIAENSNIEPNFFKGLAEELKRDKDWRVVLLGLERNHNTPKEIIDWINNDKKEILYKLGLLAEFYERRREGHTIEGLLRH